MEPNIMIKCRQDDYGLVQRLIPDAIRRYKQILQKENINTTIDDKNFLADNIAGGVEFYALEGKIKVSNTIETRLEMIFNQMLPEIRQDLFGINEHRKYYD
ncbi:unnamed protein product [Rotaria magnacalcarata]